MRLLTAILVIAAASPALSSIWGSDPQPTPWTQEQLEKSQKYFRDVKEDSFNNWNESRLRQFLLDNGIIEPKGTKEQLVQMARKQYWAYTSALSSLSQAASTAMYGNEYEQATKSAASAYSSASPQATMSSAATAASNQAVRAFDDARDHVYSNWDDNQMRTWLEEHSIIKPKQKTKRDELLAKMNQYYLSATDPIWKAWSDSYIREWLIAHNITTPPATPREKLLRQMEKYYYDANDYVWSHWTDSELHQYLIDHNIIKSDAQLKREKMEKLVQDNWSATSDAFWSSWTESEVRAWLVEHGYIRTDAQLKRDELLKLFKRKYHDVSSRTANWTTWTDARARAWLRTQGVPDEKLPGDRPSLLHETRIRYVIAEKRMNGFLAQIRDVINGSIEVAEEKLGDVLSILRGAKDEVTVRRRQVYEQAEEAAAAAESKATQLRAEASKKYEEL